MERQRTQKRRKPLLSVYGSLIITILVCTLGYGLLYNGGGANVLMEEEKRLAEEEAAAAPMENIMAKANTKGIILLSISYSAPNKFLRPPISNKKIRMSIARHPDYIIQYAFSPVSRRKI